MAESREAVDAEPDADAETSAAESEVLGTEEVSSDAAQPATSQQQPTTQHLPSNSRAMRNLMEKNRRDKLNAYISELAREVPMVACSPKRMDKTSILRLTSVFLRLHQFLSGESGGLSVRLGLPSNYLEGFDLNQLLQVMDGFMLIVTSTGKIVFVSHTVETLLGYAQADLLGQRLHDYTCPEDRATLDEKLTPDPDPGAPSDLDSSVGQMSVGEDSSSSGETTSSSSGGSQSSPSPQQQQLAVCSSSPSSSSAPGVTLIRERRSFFLRLRQRAVSRSEITQYELVHILGDLRVPRRPAPGSSTTPSGRHSNRSSRQQRDASGSNSNSRDDIVLVAVVRLVRESSVAERSLLEHSKDEYVTRHLLDGRIIYSDHRISVVAGYMAEEVAGESAFKFMHVEDMHFTITALRQMYDRGKESYGSSCYRLQSKTGQYIYLRTHGYLEYDKDTQQIVSFICINTLVSDEEGEALVREMKLRYSATVTTRHPQPEMHRAIAGPASSHTAAAPDPEELQVAISCLMSNFPIPNHGDKAEEGTETAPPDTQYEKAVLYSKALPPAKVQAQKIGLTPLLPSPRPGPQSPTAPLSVTIPETPPARAQSEPGWPTMKRESVITTCRTVERQQSVVVTTRDYEASRGRATPVVKRTISVLENDTQSGSKRHAGYAQRRRERRSTEPTPQTQEEIEEPRRTPEEQLSLIMSRSPHTTALMHCVVSPGEIRSPVAGPNSPLMYTKPPSVTVMGTPSPGGGPQSSPTCSNNSMHEFSLPFIMAGVGHTSPLDSISPPQFMPMDPGDTLTESLAPFDMLGAVPFADLDTIPTESFLEELPEQIPNATDQMEQRLAQTHHDLHSNLQLQEQDISQLEQNIQHHSLASQVYGPEIDQIRAQRKKQEQELMSLQQDHLNIHRGSSSRTSATFTTAATAAKSCQRVG